MKKKLSKIVISGGNGRFASVLKKTVSSKNYFFPNKKKLNILKPESIEKYLKKIKPKYFIHAAALSRPMKIHETQISKSIDLNIIGTCNVVKICKKLKIKLIYFSTGYVYPGTKGNYKENDSLLPWNNYGWSKLGAESSVQMYNNSLIIRACMTEKPFTHKFAFSNVKSNFIFHSQFAHLLTKVISKKGIINIGGKSQTIYDFAKKTKKNVKKKKSKGELPLKMDMNLDKLKKFIK